eukprot:1160304-Pelagomonas_calceolata.AAC.7
MLYLPTRAVKLKQGGACPGGIAVAVRQRNTRLCCEVATGLLPEEQGFSAAGAGHNCECSLVNGWAQSVLSVELVVELLRENGRLLRRFGFEECDAGRDGATCEFRMECGIELVLLRSLWDFAVPSLDVKTGIVPVLHLRPFLYASHVHSQVVMLKTGATTIWQKDALCTMVGTKWHVYELSAMDSAKCSC